MSDSNQSRINIPIIDKIIKQLVKDNIGFQFVFVKENEGNLSTSYMDLNEKTKKQLIKICQNFVEDKKNWKTMDYKTSLDNTQKNGLIRTYDKTDLKHNKSILKEPEEMETKLDDSLKEKTKMLGFRIVLPNNKFILFLKKNTKNYFIIKQEFKYLIFGGGVASIYEQGKLIRFPENFDLIIYDKDILIFNIYQFEEIFKIHLEYEKDREKVFEYIQNSADYEIPLLDEWEEKMKDSPSMLRKFKSIIQKNIYTQPIKEIKKALAARPVKGVNVKGDKLKFHSPQDFISFFNDNHLDSYFTSKKYEVNSKTEEE